MKRTEPDDSLHTLQSLIWPEQGICTERDLYVRLHGPAGWSESRGIIEFTSGGTARFNTAFNIFNVTKWRRNCGLDDLHLVLRGSGRFEVSVVFAIEDRSWDRVLCEIVALDGTSGHRIDLSHLARRSENGVVYFELKALGEGTLASADWQTRQAPRRQPHLALSITTFKRENAVRASVNRFETFMRKTPLADRLHLIVVDNGQSAGITASAHVTSIPNENLGGSGGFARGLLEAERRGATHCLFMDDDASIHMASLERTWMFLAYAIDPATAVAGALTMGNHRWAIWENGAIFDRSCKPRFLGTDLRDPMQFLEMEFESAGRQPAQLYGGWWYFAFPIDHARFKPFPFFVRGDDVSFGLANDFQIVTLPGVLSFQDADFSAKESLQTLYLDLRSHLAHHVALPAMDIGWKGALSIPLMFFARSLIQCHYETLSALNLAFEDFMAGPAFFEANADMAQRRKDIAGLRKSEAWQDAGGPRKPDRVIFNPKNPVARLFMKLTLNGHVLPFFSAYGNRITLMPQDRGHIRKTWGAAEITYYDAKEGKSFTVRHSKGAALREGVRLLRNAARFVRDYRRIQDGWRSGYQRLATDSFWMRRLGLAENETAAGDLSRQANTTA
ncbi:hypothetical protein [Albidovulum sp.]|uniref:hypothetical protein n=1 Tax=Albidovulum sp. TaxID=1872424 RepID=UPI0039B8B573